MPYHEQAYTTAAITAGVLGSVYAAYKIYQNQKSKLPTDWKKVGTIKDLYAYPIKSCGSVVLKRAECSILGFKDGWLRDRVLMIIDEKNNFITARGYPELLTVHTSVKSSVLTLKHDSMEDLCVNLAEVIESGVESQIAYVWSTPVPVLDCGLQASEWISKLLNRHGMTFRLAYYASQKSHVLREKSGHQFYKFTKNDTGALQDEVPYNIINLASVEDLKSRLKDCQISPDNFRPNMVLEGAKPYEEDTWKFVKVGDNVFEIIKPCTRCILTTIDPETGVRNNKGEPLQTLKGYRQIENVEERKAAGHSPRMGLQMSLRSAPGGLISVNDPVYVA